MEIEYHDSGEYLKWFDRLGAIEQAKVVHLLDHFATNGMLLKMPHLRYLGAGLFELRVTVGQQPRLYVEVEGPERGRILTVGRKDTQQRDIDRARRRMT